MSTITREFTKEQLIEQARKNIEVLRGAAERIPGASDAAVIHLKLAEITLASLEAEAGADERYQHLSELYRAQEKRLFKLAQRIKGPSFDKYAYSPSQAIDVLESALFGENDEDCRAAMLQGAEPVTPHDDLPLDYLQGHKDGLEWAAQLVEANHPQTGDWLYDDPIELAKAIRKGPDMTDADGNFLVVPDGWAPCSDRLPENNPGSYEYIVFETLNNRAHHDYWNVPDVGDDAFTPFWNHYGEYVTHWMPLPAAPQQDEGKTKR